MQMMGGTRDKGRHLRKRQSGPDFNRARCWLNVVGDYKFVQSVGGSATATGQLLNIIQQVCTCTYGYMHGVCVCTV